MAVLRGGALGDVLLGFPALRALRQRFPGATLQLVAPLPQARLAVSMGLADSVTGLDDPALVPLFLERGDLARLPAALRRLDLALVWLHGGHVIAANLARLGTRQVLESRTFPQPALQVHSADWLLQSLAPLGVAPVPGWEASPWLTVPEGARSWAAGWVAEATGGRPFAVLHPGSGSWQKNWPAGSWAGVIGAVQAARPLQLVVTAGEADDAPLAAFQAARTGAAPDQQAGSTPRPSSTPPPGLPDVVLRQADLERLAGILQGAALYLGNDSGVTHLAAGLGVPTVAVFGPTDPALWRPRGPRVRVLGGAPIGWPDEGAVRQAALEILPP
jgi:ADP-heptose:LPS heptosyltransferase